MNRSYRTLLTSLFLSAFAILAGFTGLNPVWAQDAEEEFIPDGIPPLSNRTALLSFPLSVFPFNEPNKVPIIRLQELQELTVVFEDRTVGRMGLDILEDFLELSTSAINSGLALYKESESKRGFSYSVDDQSKDLPIDLLERPIVQKDPVVAGRFTVTFRPVPGSANVQLPFFKDQFADFYVVARTSLNLMHGDRFEVYIPENGIKIRDLRQTLPKNTVYDFRFPGEGFADLNPLFTIPSIFEGDIVTVINLTSDLDGRDRVSASSEPKTILGLDMAGRDDQGYFLEEVRVNFLGINLGAVARVIANLAIMNYDVQTAGMLASMQMGSVEQVISMDQPTFFYSPWFYNTPFDMSTGMPLTTLAPGDWETEMPLTMPVNIMGMPQRAFMLGGDDPNNHITSYVAYGPRQLGSLGLTPRVITQDMLKALRSDVEGGIFLFREIGGTKGKYDKGVDHLINLNKDQFRVETFEISPEAASDPTSPLNALMRRMLPGQVAGERGKQVIPWLFGDDNLGTVLMGIMEMPDPATEPRPSLGTLECLDDPDCYFLDLMINVLRPYLGLTEGQMRYLFEYTEGNGRTNSEDLFDFNLLQGFSFVLPVARNNAISDLRAPNSRTGEFASGEIYIAIQTSDNLRSLDCIIPFIRPNDVKVGTQVKSFTEGKLENVQTMRSVSSIGYRRANTADTFSLIGRPQPRFLLQDLTQPGEGEFAGNNRILYDSSMSSPPKAVIGIDAQDFGQNPHLVTNHETYQYNMFDTFFTENTVLGEIQIDFLPGARSVIFNPAILNVIPQSLGISVEFNRVVSSHSVALYFDDDTPEGNGRDDDGDGLVDEEWYNLQDDDGDGLIDEDLGDNTPAGTNGVFDSRDSFFPPEEDRFGGREGEYPTYAFPPNSQTKFQDYITAIQPVDNPITLTDGGPILLNLGEGSFFCELDMRALYFPTYIKGRSEIFPLGFRSGSDYNSGMTSRLDPRTGLMDLIPAMRMRGGDFEFFPYYPEDLFLEDAESGDLIWMVVLTSESEDDVGVIGDPDVRRSFALSFNSAFRFPNPLRGFCRVGMTPMVVDVGENTQNPQGDGITTAPNHQFGFDISITDRTTINDYLRDLTNTLGDAYEQARDAIAQYNTDVEEAIATAQEAEEPTDPEYPDLPDPIEVSATHPGSAFGINDFLEQNNGIYATNYAYQIQIPDENFGPLAGNDFYVVLRSSPVARVGETFRVRIRSGQRNATLTTTDTQAGTTTTVARPQGGIGYSSFIETDYDLGGRAFVNVSKNQITTDEIVVQSINVAPSLTFLSPTSGTNLADENFRYTINFSAQDPDDVAEVLLYVDTDTLNFDGDFIPGAILREGFDTSFTINLLEDIKDFDPLQKYYIYARLDDRVNAPVYVYADGPITTTAASTGSGDPGSGDPTSGRIVTGDLDNPLDYVKLRNDGNVFSFGDASSLVRVESTTRVVDMEVNPTFSGMIALQVDGKVLGSGDLGLVFSRVLQPNGSFAFPADQVYFYKNDLAGGQLIQNPTESQITIESARDVEVDFTNGAIYVLDGDGDMLFLGKANVALRPQPVGIDIYRDMELGPGGNSMYFLTGNGMMSAVGSPSVPSWSNIVVGDVYRDMDLRVRGGVATHVVITDADGNLTVVGPSGSVTSTILSLELTLPISEPGVIRQVKLFPDTDNTLMLIEGGGRVHYMTNEEKVVVPTDRLIFSDQEGLDDDRIVDTETTSVNLQSVISSVRDIIDAFNKENVSRIMAYVSPDYKDKSGMNANDLRKSLSAFFEFFEIENYTETKNQPNSFILTNQGSTINAQVIVDMSVWFPSTNYYSPQLQASSTVGETIGRMLFSQTSVAFDQTISIREVNDGRGWLIDLYEIRNFGRRINELLTSEEMEFDDITYLLSLTKNRRMGTYIPRKVGPDEPMMVRLDIDEKDSLAPFNVLMILREPYLTRNAQPPVMEYTLYTGSFISLSGYDTINYTFKRNADGSVKLTSMNVRQMMSSNDSQFLTVDTTGDTQNPLSSLDGVQVTTPFGFNFSRRGPVRTVFQGDADITFPDNQTIQASFPLGGIMMLPENVDIFSLNPNVLVGQTITRTTVKVNPYDPNRASLTGMQGMTASLIPGRGYFVIASDGKHYGFIHIPAEAAQLSDTTEIPIIPMDFRYEDSFILPSNF